MITVREAAERTGAAESSIRVWLSRGRFPGAVLQQPTEGVPGVPYWLIPESEIDGFQRLKPGPKPGAKKAAAKKARTA